MQVPSSTSHGEKGFFASLFDIHFSSLIIARIIKVVYVIAIILVGLEAIGGLITALASKRVSVIILAIIFVPIVSLFSLIWIRILLELVIIIFRIGEDVRHIAVSPRFDAASGQASGATAEPVWRSAEATGGVVATSNQESATSSMTESVRAEPEPVTVGTQAVASQAASSERTATADLPVAGWYADPQYEGYARFWDGQSWTDQRRQRNL
jgi:Domain of unknown function (DUF4282)/Protein of unknown function (DUF2510)